jgi:hypothetical protein
MEFKADAHVAVQQDSDLKVFSSDQKMGAGAGRQVIRLGSILTQSNMHSGVDSFHNEFGECPPVAHRRQIVRPGEKPSSANGG